MKKSIEMKPFYFYLVIVVGLAGLPLVSEAQFIASYREKGDDYFEQEEYYAAAIYYQKALNLLPDTSGQTYFLPYFVSSGKKDKVVENAEKYQYLVYRLGESFRLYKDFKSAEQWYDKASKFENAEFPLVQLWMGVCLRADGKYDQAIGRLRAFLSAYNTEDSYRQRANLELKSCQYALEQMRYPRLVEVRKIYDDSMEVDNGSDYAPIRSHDTLYFTSSRALNEISKKNDNPYVNKIYRAPLKGSDAYGDPGRVKLSDDKFQQNAAASLTGDGETMYVTEWRPGKKRHQNVHYIISRSGRDESGGFTESEPMGETINMEGTNNKGASVTANGKYLIFSSDRPGGLGGYDLWYCKLDGEGNPLGEAVHLGDSINSEGDDVSPYYEETTERLFFSSNGRVGMGGFDLYYSKGGFSGGLWSEAVNLGYPANSSKDDMFYYPVGDRRFYTSSDRSSVCCLALFDVQLKRLRLIGNVYDKKTKEPLENATIVIKDSITDKVLATFVAGSDGAYAYSLDNRRPLSLSFAKEKYFTVNTDIPTFKLRQVDSVFRQDAYLIGFEVNKPIILPNILYNFDKSELRPHSKQVLDTIAIILKDNPQMIIRISSHTDSKGRYSYNIGLSQRRAQSCVDYLISKGIAKDRLIAKGYGESKPIAPNANADGSDNVKGRQLNRRTDFTVLDNRKSDSIYIESVPTDRSELEEAVPEQNYKGYNFYISRKSEIKR